MQNKHSNLAPFSCSYTPNTPELLNQLGCTIAISTYQAGKLIFLSAVNDEKIVQLPRSFVKAMGIALDGDRLALACKDEVIVFKNSSELASHYPRKKDVYDAMYMPRITYHTGALDVHDLDFCQDGLYAVNTNFSCVIRIDENYSFRPIWTPAFISDVQAGDRCHLNGMAVENKTIKYLTSFANTNTPRGWKENMTTSGILIEYASKEIVLENLGMPHSPRIYNENLYMLLSASGELVKYDPSNNQQSTVTKIEGFVRGLSFHEGFAFIGISKIRNNSSSFGHLNIAEKSNHAGVVIVHLESGVEVARIIYNSSVDEIYDVQIIANKVRPNILNTIKEDYKMGLSTPEKTFWGVKKEK